MIDISEPATAAAADRPGTKVAVVLRDDLALWQRLNVTAFLTSAIVGSDPELIGEPYQDADRVRYLPMLRQPVLVFEADAALIKTAHQRALRRDLAIAIFTADLFSTGNDADNRAAVARVATADLDLVGIAVRGPRNAVDRTLKGARLHP